MRCYLPMYLPTYRSIDRSTFLSVCFNLSLISSHSLADTVFQLLCSTVLQPVLTCLSHTLQFIDTRARTHKKKKERDKMQKEAERERERERGANPRCLDEGVDRGGYTERVRVCESESEREEIVRELRKWKIGRAHV